MSKKQISQKDNDQEFWDLTEQFVELANGALENAEAGKIAAAM